MQPDVLMGIMEKEAKTIPTPKVGSLYVNLLRRTGPVKGLVVELSVSN
jgi:hypothetical protein